MLFNSYVFLFSFLPVVFLVFVLLGRHSSTLAALWLAIGSLFFYGWWNIAFVPLLLSSIAFNYVAGYWIAKTGNKAMLAAAIAANLGTLGYFKYANFIAANLQGLLGWPAHFAAVLLPIGISFFTFTQIAFLVDAFSGKAREYRFVHYCLFVSYFPHLIAGPVLHHRQMMPQFALRSTYRINWDNIALGITIFAIGLFKKTVLADGVADYAVPVFDAARDGSQVYLFESWVGALAYTMQLYFDFSGYSDMAIGLSRIFNVKLPLNFNSPYQATNIIDFWRRWHMTLSQFLRDYLYFPLGGNRFGVVRRYLNLMITMVLGGLWHGAGWTFAAWGGLHGLYLMINHGWRACCRRIRGGAHQPGLAERACGGFVTFIAVVVAWVFFRASSVSSAAYLIGSMLGLHGISLPEYLRGTAASGWPVFADARFNGLLTNIHGPALVPCLWILLLSLLVWLMPNTQQLTIKYEPASDLVTAARTRIHLLWRPSSTWAAIVAIFLALGILEFNKISAFLYFQF
jgi:alginate O-acetyltransferase complex protein AlgI